MQPDDEGDEVTDGRVKQEELQAVHVRFDEVFGAQSA